MKKILLITASCLVFSFLLWWFYFREPLSSMVLLLNGDHSVSITYVSIKTQPNGKSFYVDDYTSLEYLTKSLRRAKTEGRTPTSKRNTFHTAYIWLGTFSCAKVGISNNQDGGNFTIVYPIHEDGSSDPVYYKFHLDQNQPHTVKKIFDKIR